MAWSPKSACSHVVLWAFIHEGLFQAANAYDAWPHKFRAQVYFRDDAFQAPWRDLLRSGGAGHTLLKVTTAGSEEPPGLDLPARLPVSPSWSGTSRRCSVSTYASRGLSLTDLDAVLNRLKLVAPTTVDPHVCAQYTPLWDLAFDRVITLDLDEESRLNAGLNAVEGALGLPATELQTSPAFRNLRETHYARESTFDRNRPIETYRFRPRETHAFPKRAADRLAAARKHGAVTALRRRLRPRHGTGDVRRRAVRPAAGAAMIPVTPGRWPSAPSTGARQQALAGHRALLRRREEPGAGVLLAEARQELVHDRRMAEGISSPSMQNRSASVGPSSRMISTNSLAHSAATALPIFPKPIGGRRGNLRTTFQRTGDQS